MARLIMFTEYTTGLHAATAMMDYIAKREGVVHNELGASKRMTQEELIKKICDEFPDVKNKLIIEWKKYMDTGNKFVGSRFITHAFDLIAVRESTPEVYLNYIAERPGAIKNEMMDHGLFNDAGFADLKLEKRKLQMLDEKVPVWTHIISLTRQDAKTLGYDQKENWEELLRRNMPDIAKAMNIDVKYLTWNAAFHDEGHHPHIHLQIYSSKTGMGYCNVKSIEKIKSKLANDIFYDEMQIVKTERNYLRKKLEHEFVQQVNDWMLHPQNREEVESLQSVVMKKRSFMYQPKEIKKEIVDMMKVLLNENHTVQELHQNYNALESYYKKEDQKFTSKEQIVKKMLDGTLFGTKENRRNTIHNHFIQLLFHQKVNVELPEEQPDKLQQYTETRTRATKFIDQLMRHEQKLEQFEELKKVMLKEIKNYVYNNNVKMIKKPKDQREFIKQLIYDYPQLNVYCKSLLQKYDSCSDHKEKNKIASQIIEMGFKYVKAYNWTAVSQKIHFINVLKAAIRSSPTIQDIFDEFCQVYAENNYMDVDTVKHKFFQCELDEDIYAQIAKAVFSQGKKVEYDKLRVNLLTMIDKERAIEHNDIERIEGHRFFTLFDSFDDDVVILKKASTRNQSVIKQTQHRYIPKKRLNQMKSHSKTRRMYVGKRMKQIANSSQVSKSVRCRQRKQNINEEISRTQTISRVITRKPMHLRKRSVPELKYTSNHLHTLVRAAALAKLEKQDVEELSGYFLNKNTILTDQEKKKLLNDTIIRVAQEKANNNNRIVLRKNEKKLLGLDFKHNLEAHAVKCITLYEKKLQDITLYQPQQKLRRTANELIQHLYSEYQELSLYVPNEDKVYRGKSASDKIQQLYEVIESKDLKSNHFLNITRKPTDTIKKMIAEDAEFAIHMKEYYKLYAEAKSIETEQAEGKVLSGRADYRFNKVFWEKYKQEKEVAPEQLRAPTAAYQQEQMDRMINRSVKGFLALFVMTLENMGQREHHISNGRQKTKNKSKQKNNRKDIDMYMSM